MQICEDLREGTMVDLRVRFGVPASRAQLRMFAAKEAHKPLEQWLQARASLGFFFGQPSCKMVMFYGQVTILLLVMVILLLY